MRPIFLLLLLTLFSSALVAQSPRQFDLQARVTDAADDSPLISATVMLLSVQDSSLISFGRTEDDGSFQLKGLLNDQAYLLRLTYLGYQTLDVPLPFPVDREKLDLGNLKMGTQSALLDEVIVQEEHIPVRINKDTIEYNARAFKTQPNAPVEDLLKKLPGMEVDREGNIRAQGERVEQVMVDGKEFFGRDPKAATRNLPAEAVDKVQVYDKKSDQAEFSGVDDGSRQKTVNLELKNDFKKGAFGSAEAGYGTEDRFNLKGSLNRFTPKQQLSLIAMGNNINRQGFSINDYMQFSGAMRRMMSGGGGTMQLTFNSDEMDFPIDFGSNTGFTTTWAGGLNFNHDWKNGSELNGSYVFDHLDRDTETTTLRENYLPTGTLRSEDETFDNNLRQGHRFNIGLERELDTLNQIRWDLRLNSTKNERLVEGSGRTLDAANTLQNESERYQQLQGQRRNVDSEFLFRHRFKAPGRSLTAGLNFNLGDNVRQADIRSWNRYYHSDQISLDSIMQEQSTNSENLGYGLNLTHIEPLGKRRYLEFSYYYNHLTNRLDREVLDLEDGTGRRNEGLSNAYQNDYDYHRLGAQFRLNRRRFNFMSGVHRQESRLLGRLMLPDGEIRRKFGNWLPVLQFNFEPISGKNLRFDYRTSIREPDIQQLQPLLDNTDPLNLYIGNPDLQAAYEHNLSLSYLSFNQVSMSNIFAFVNFRYAKNAISTAQTIDEQFRRTLQPVNVDNDYEFNANLSYGFRIRPIKSRFELRGETRLGRSINLLNETPNQTYRLLLSPQIRWSFTGNEKLEPYLEVAWDNNRIRYTGQSEVTQNYSNLNYQAGLDADLPARFTFSTSFDLNNYYWSDRDAQSVPIWNLSLSRFLLKGDRGELKFSVFDLLNKNLGIDRYASLSFFQEQRIRSLGRYFMLSFTYAIRQQGGAHVRMSGGMRVMRRR
ncbi:outer membrane beta-barrel family protein [Flavilitoribacter nigricans]|uniref:TonB-dependent receptor n=1 Tax=Flavilitoribacter nigricans (strain ATCC 23147 / DSM 23189 / NBRC 102662 / NCIMB 1420 / SS-2) TaxID=1122177 RepID=A0A2D0NG85_FLAN2|nr:outer membrane beta-barrel family protein [Flavilitoribacter nigricans]PHN07514.1 TonB-dependent receptor [Flavilitoribacter nigricans DSM 23189 = NBRC 102662]